MDAVTETIKRLKKKWPRDYISSEVLKNVDIWLRQFKEIDKSFALKIFEKLDYVSHKEISDFLFQFHEDMTINYHEDEMVIVPVTKVTWNKNQWEFNNDDIKSGHIMQVLYLQNNSSMTEFEINNRSPFTKTITKKYYENAKCIIFLDDFIGTGNTVNNFIQAFYSRYKIPLETETFLVCYAIMEDAYTLLKPRFTKIFYVFKYPSLFKNIVIWGSDDPHSIKEAMKIYELGFDLYGKGDHYKFLFGFGQTGSSIFFEHNTPNNNLSSLWNNNWNTVIKDKWVPILIRFSKNSKEYNYKSIIDSSKVKAEMANQYREKRG